MSAGRSMSSGGSVIFLTIFGTMTQVLGFGYRVALSRLIGAEVMGLYQLIMPVYAVMQSVTAVGLAAACSNLTSEHLALGNPRAVAQVRRTCMVWLVALMIPISAVVLTCSDPISVYWLGDARTQLGLMLLLPCVLLTGVENIHKQLFYGAGLVRTPAVVDLVEQAIRAAAVLGLLICFLPQYPERVVGLVVCGMVVCEIFSSCTMGLLFGRALNRWGRGGAGQPAGERRRRVLSIAFPVGVNALMGNLMGAVNAALVPKKLVESGLAQGEAVAQFGVVCGMTIPMLALPTVYLGAISLVLVPGLARLVALGQRRKVEEKISRAMALVSVLTLPIMAMMVVLGSDLGMLLFQQEEVGRYLTPLALAMALGCYQSVLAASLNGVGRQGTVARISLLCDLVQLGFTAGLVGIPGIGMGGFVLGVVVSSVLGLVLCARETARHTGMTFSIFQWITAPGLGALLMGLTCRLLYQMLRDSGGGFLVAGGCTMAFGSVLYLAALHAQGVSIRGFIRG